MNYRGFVFLLFLLKAIPSFATNADTLKVFYSINVYQLSTDDKTQINQLVKSLNDQDTICIFGYADYLGNSRDNLTLSRNRAETIKRYMLTLNSQLRILSDGRGQVDATTTKTIDVNGEAINRRVDIIKIALVKAIKLPVKSTAVTVSAARPPINNPHIVPYDRFAKRQDDSVPASDTAFRDKIKNLEKLDVGGSVSFEEITFQMGRHYLNPEAAPYLLSLLKYLKIHNNISFMIIGHVCCAYTDTDGYDRDTREDSLSANRAKFIYGYFLKNGIKGDRMTYKGLGSTKPKVWPEKSPHDEYLNRRVEIMIVGK